MTEAVLGWTVGAWRVLHRDGRPMFRLTRHEWTSPTEADALCAEIAAALNNQAASLTTLRTLVNLTRSPGFPNIPGWQKAIDDATSVIERMTPILPAAPRDESD